jgi:hypothetical protein
MRGAIRVTDSPAELAKQHGLAHRREPGT